MTFATTSATASSTSSSHTSTGTAAAGASNSKKGLSGGAIAGIVVGSIAGAALIGGLIFLLCMCIRRRRGSQNGSVFNQPSPARKNTTGMAYNPVAATTTSEGYEVLPGGRIARMSALEGHSGDSPSRGELGAIAAGGAAGAAAGYAGGRRRHHDQSSSDEYSTVSNN